MSDIFDLNKIAGLSYDVEVPSKKLDMKSMLADYSQVPIQEWKNIPIGAKIRYSRKDGSFKSGGIVRSISISSKDKSIKIELASEYIKNPATWSIISTKIDKIWMKNSGYIPVTSSNEDLSELKEKVRILEESIAQISKEIQIMRNQIASIYSMVKKK